MKASSIDFLIFIDLFVQNILVRCLGCPRHSSAKNPMGNIKKYLHSWSYDLVVEIDP